MFGRWLGALARLWMVLFVAVAGCDTAEEHDTAAPIEVSYYAAERAYWLRAPLTEVPEGADYRIGDDLYRMSHEGVEWRGRMSLAEVGAAGQQWSGDTSLPARVSNTRPR